MWRLTWHRAADAPQGGQEPLAPPAPAPQEGATTRPVLTENLLLAAISDPEKTRLLTELIKTASQADIDVAKAETECHKDLQKSQTEQLNSRFRNKITWGTGGAALLVGVLWAFGVLHAMKSLHLPVSPGVATGVSTFAFATLVGTVTAVARKIRTARIARRAVSEVTARAGSARTDTVTELPVGLREPPQGQAGGQSQADVS